MRTASDDSPWTLVGASSSGEYPLALEVEQRTDASFSLTLASLTLAIRDQEARQLLDDLQSTIFQLVKNSDRKLPAGMRNSQISQQNQDHYSGLPHVHENHDDESFLELSLVREHVSALAEVEAGGVHPDKSIFELGLDSIDAIKLSSRLKSSGFKISMSQIMQLATLRKIAKGAIKQEGLHDVKRFPFDKTATLALLSARGIDTSIFESVLPATPLQEGLISRMMQSKYQHYLNHEILEVKSGVDVEQLVRAWRDVIHANPILRTSFVEIDDLNSPVTYIQVVRKAKSPIPEPINVEDGSNHDDLIRQAQKVFTSGKPEQTMFLVQPVLTNGQNLLLLSMAHALYDGTSLAMLHHDVRKSYRGEAHRRPSYDFFVAESVNQQEDANDFWRDQLQGMKPTKFITNQQDISNSAICFVEHISIRDEGSISQYCQKQGITLQTLGLTSWLIVLAHRTRQLDVCSGLVLSGRSSEESEKIMFPAMNTVAFRSIIHGAISDMFRYVQETISRISEYQHFPLRKARHAAGLAEPPFDSIFLLQRSNGDISEENTLYESKVGISRTEYPINVEWEAIDGELIFRASCSEEVFPESESAQLLGDMDRVLSFFLKNPGNPVMSIEHGEISLCGLPRFSVGQSSRHEPAWQVELPSETPSSPQVQQLEQTIMEILSQVSGVPEHNITIETSIFEIGLDSISAIKVSSQLRKQSIKLTVSDIMRCMTPRNMSCAATDRSAFTDIAGSPGDFNSEAIDIAQITKRLGLATSSPSQMPSEIEAIIPAAPGQEYMLQMWMKSIRKDTDTTGVFYPCFYFETSTEISKDGLQTAWTKLIRQLPILRSMFLSRTTKVAAQSETVSTFYQVVLDTRLQQSPVHWIDTLSDKNQKAESLVAPVLLSAAGSNNKTLLRLQIHHALYDAVSLPLIISGLQELCRKEDAVLDINTDFPSFLGPSMNQSATQRREIFWKGYFEGFIPPRSRESTGIVSQHSRTEILRPRLISNFDRLIAKARTVKVSLQSLFFAVYAYAYARHHQYRSLPGKKNELEEVILGIYLANRSHDIMNLSSLIAPTLNITPLRIAVPRQSSEDGSFCTAIIEAAKEVQQDLGEISKLENCGASLADIFRWTAGRVRVNTTVNFIRVPGPDSNENEQALEIRQQEGDETGKKITISDIDRRDFEEALGKKFSCLPQAPLPVPASELHEWPDSEAYIPSLDIEAAIRSNSLDVGIFAPSPLLSGEQANKLFDELKDTIQLLIMSSAGE